MSGLKLLPGGMLPKAYNEGGQLTHARDCLAAFGHYDKRCFRCLELIAGKPPRAGWAKKPCAGQRWLPL